METNSRAHILGHGPINELMIRFAVPSIIAMLVSALYNMVDQIFIGQFVGTLGNAATNIAFPLSMSCTAIALLFGIGGASSFNLHMGRKEYEKAPFFIGNSLTMLIGCGTLLCLITQIFLRPMLIFFGSPSNVLPYALEYVQVTSIGFPFLILTIGGGHLVRADGSPNMAMISNLSGAILNTVLDALFVIVFHWGMFGAALATVIGQIFSALLILNYMRNFKTLPLKRDHLIPRLPIVLQGASLGTASCVNQFAMMAMQILLNNTLRHYGALSVYGESIPIACAGIVTKVNQLFFSVVIGLAQGSQPIESFNYGAKQYKRVRDTYLLTIRSAFLVSIAAFALFQLIPEKLLSVFGSGSPEYYEFGVRFFRIYLFFTWANCVQPATSQFFASVGKPLRGMFVSLTRQIFFLVPLLILLPLYWGIEGILFAGPVADALAAVTALIMVRVEFLDMYRLERQVQESHL